MADVSIMLNDGTTVSVHDDLKEVEELRDIVVALLPKVAE